MADKQHQFSDCASHLAALDSAQWSELEAAIARFEAAWRAGSVPTIAEFLPRDDPDPAAILLELIATDLQWRWRSGLTATAEDYLSQFPQLRGNARLLAHLATSEFIARRRAGVAVDCDQFVRRFPDCGEQLRAALFQAATASLDADAPDGADSPNQDAPNQLSDASPKIVGRYKLLREIGRGAFGSVHEAIDTELGRRVAIKLPRHAMTSHSEGRTRFVREAQHLARLSHSAIVPVLDAGWMDDLFYIVCALVEGPTLADRLRDGPIEPCVAAAVVATLGDALEHAHRQGVVHRDVKPGNILFDAGGSPWLTDFGLASSLGAEATLTLDGQLLGTPAYMAPEQAAGAAHRLDARSDVYSLGVVLYESLSGRLPFVGSASAIIEQIRICDPLPLTRLGPRIDRDLERVCLKALEKRPADRYQTAAAFADDLRKFLAGEPTRARPPGAARRLFKWARRRPAIAMLSTVSLLAALALTVVVWWHNVQLRDALLATDDARQQAVRLQRTSQQSQQQTERLLYAADMRLATNACLNGDRTETLRRLQRYAKPGNGPDRREFAWRRLWSLCHADQKSLVGHVGDVYQLQVVSDGRQLVSSGRDGTIRWWTNADGKGELVAQFQEELGFVAVSPDGKTLVGAGDGGTIHIWDVLARREMKKVFGHSMAVLCGATSPRGDQLATAGQDNVIRLWTLPHGELVAELHGHTQSVESLTYLPDGQSLASAGSDGTLRLWNLLTKQGTVLATTPAAALSVACSHDGSRLATACADHSIYVCDVSTRRLQGSLHGHAEIVQSVAFSADDTQLASAGRDGTVRVWDMKTLTQVESFLGHSARVWSVAWLPDGATLASAGGDGSIRMWRCGTSRFERTVSVPTEVQQVSISRDQRRVWLAAKKQGVHGLQIDDRPASPIAITGQLLDLARTRDVLATKTGDHQVCLYDGEGKPLFEPVQLPIRIGLMAISSAGDLLAITTTDSELYVFGIPTFDLRWARAVPGPGSPSVQFTRQDDALLVAGAESAIAMYDVADGAESLAFRSNQLHCVTISPDGKLIAVGCTDRAIRIVDVVNRTETNCLPGHDGAVQSLAFSPDGQTLAAGTSNGSVVLWHVPSWQEIGNFKTKAAAINDLRFSADSNTLAIGGRAVDGGGHVVLWTTKPIED